MNISRFAVHRPVTTAMTHIAVTLLGLFALGRLAIDPDSGAGLSFLEHQHPLIPALLRKKSKASSPSPSNRPSAP